MNVIASLFQAPSCPKTLDCLNRDCPDCLDGWDPRQTICLDLRYKTESGVTSYISSITTRILADSHYKYVVVKYSGQRIPDGVETIVSPGNPVIQFLWDNIVLPFLLWRHRVSVFHNMKFGGPIWKPVQKIVTCHSLWTLKNSRYPSTLAMKIFLFLHTALLKRQTTRIIAVSEYLKNHLVQDHGFPAEKIDVILNGVDATFRPARKDQIESIRQHLHLSQKYLLCVGNVLPVKGQKSAIAAFAKIASSIPHDLVLAGRDSHSYAVECKDYAQKIGVQDRVKFIGYQERANLIAIMSGADLLVVPSITEGFGLAMAEGFRCGVPAVAAAIPALLEIGKTGAVFFQPNDPEDFSGKITYAIANRDRLRGELKATPDWEESARAHMKTYSALFLSPNNPT